MEYKIFDPVVSAPLHTLSRSEAKQHFKLHISSLSDRIEELKWLLSQESVDLDFSVKSVRQIDNWFPKQIHESKSIPGEPDGKSFSICNDVAMYLGEVLIRTSSWIKWDVNTLRKNDISYHRPVLINFKGVKNKNYNIDFDLVLCQYAHRIIKGSSEEGIIVKMIESAIDKSK